MSLLLRQPSVPENKVDEMAREERIDIRVGTPKQQILHIFKTKDYGPAIKAHKKFVRKMCANPIQYYGDMRRKLDLHGETASFKEEFEGVVGFLTKYLFQTATCTEWFQKQPVVLSQLVPSLVGIQIESRYSYPYRATIYVIQRMLSIIDRFHRSNRELPPYYHNFRYEYYMTLLTDVANNDIVIFPTCFNVGATALIKVRCVPIHILGVVNEPTYADQYWNSPLDFWAHDVNHGRRTMLETEWFYDTYVKHRTYMSNRNYFSIVSKMQFYQEMDDFTKNVILPLITPVKNWPSIRRKARTERSTYENQLYALEGHKALMRLLIFEIVHEKAWPMTPKSLLRNIVHKYDKFPVESIVVIDDKISTRDFTFDDPTTLSNTIHKIRGGFYDNPNDIIEAILPMRFRTSRALALAAKELYNRIANKYYPEVDRPSMELLLALVTDQHDTDEFRDKDVVKELDVPAPNQPYPDRDFNAIKLKF
jgi:hypothetical protein